MRIYTKNTYYNTLSENLIYQNYHKHSMYTNVLIVDSAAYPEEYAKRAVQLGHGIISSCEHGYQGRYIESFEMAQQYNLKYLFAVEAYFVYDRFEKDNTNAHIMLCAKNENGRKAINRILSQSNTDGFYYRARIDYDLLMTLPENDVWITSACLGGINKYIPQNEKSERLLSVWKEFSQYESPYEMLVDKIHQKFGDNFFLEVQAHNTIPQAELNTKIIELSKKYNIEIIAGVDSHYIYPEDAWKRDYLQKSSGIFMEDEQGWFMDYPDGQTLFHRFQTQKVLTDDEIKVAISNTNVFLEVEEYTSPIFNHEMKMPSAPKYQNMTDEEKQIALMKIVKDRWDEIKHEIPEEKHQHYLKEIAKELDIIFKIKHADYFLLNYEIIKDAVENRGGMITFSGRGCLCGECMVETNKGLIPLKDIEIGMYVKSDDLQYHEVLNTYKFDIEENLVLIYLANGGLLKLTKDHKVLTMQGWSQAQNIKSGFYIVGDGINHQVIDVEYINYKGLVYDLTIKDTSNYMAEGVIVHNSGPSFYVNHLLGFTQIDRISSPITLYPERFLSTSRMTAGSLADIDFNCGNTPVFESSQQDILGQEHAYPMIAYGKLKPKAAWKMYCRAVDVPFEVSNEISSKIDEYESDLKYWDEESGEEEPNVLDYIPDELQDYFLKSKEFLGLIDHASRHPCGNLLLTQDIKEEVGIVRLKSKGGRETICACLDGLWCEKYLMLKNDLLTVTCVRLVYDLYKRVGLPYMSLNKLLEEVKIHPEVWDMYEKGYVIGLNQVERNSTKRKVMKYKPKNISELSAFIAGIRPAFKSLVDKLINREHFEYGIPTLDNLLQTEELPESFILYQEQIMKILAFAGIPMGDCYTVIKSISKKRFKKIMHYKEQFLTGMAQKLIEAENIDELRANDVAKTIWGIIEDASAYGFNSSHSLSVSFDSLLAAYFKALYPLEFYEVYLNLQMEKAKKDKAFLAQQEMKEAFNIKLLPMRFGQDNRRYTAYSEQNAISTCMKSIKGFGNIVGEELFRLARHEYDTFLDLLIAMEYYVDLYPLEVWNDYISKYDIDENISNEIIKCINYYLKNKDNPEILINKKPITLDNVFSISEIEGLDTYFEESKYLWKIKVNDTQVETLIMLNYFEQYGRNNKLLEIFKLFNKYYSRKTLKKDKIEESGIDMNILEKYIGKETKAQYSQIDFKGYINELSQNIEDKYIPLPEQLKFERELFEIPIYQNKEMPETWSYVMSFKTYGDKINTPYLILYNLRTGELSKCQINSSALFRSNPFGIYSIIDAKNIEPVAKKKNVNGKWIKTDEFKQILKEYDVIIRDKNAELNEVLKDD